MSCGFQAYHIFGKKSNSVALYVQFLTQYLIESLWGCVNLYIFWDVHCIGSKKLMFLFSKKSSNVPHFPQNL